MTTYTAKGLDRVKVGDLVAPIGTHGSSEKWTGVLRPVVRVGEKRFSVTRNGDWIDKITGHSIGKGGSKYMLATPEMIAMVERKDQERKARQLELDALHQRPEYRYATAIYAVLEMMQPENHPLDRLTVEEWQAFHAKLCGKES